jgi:hypothetical protein
VPANQLALKDWPFTLRLDATGPADKNLFRVIFGANYTLSATDFTRLVSENVQNVIRAGSVNSTSSSGDGSECKLEFKALSDHSRTSWPQEADRLRKGFVQQLYSLQGYRGMWFTGYAWGTPYSSTIWANTDIVLERMIESFKGT